MKRLLTGIVALALIAPVATRAEITAEVVRVGFPGDGDSPNFCRGGAWMPVALRLNLRNEEPRTVFIRIEQPDRDGDLVYVQKMVALTPDLKGAAVLHWLYIVPNPDTRTSASNLTVKILDENEEAISVYQNGREVRKVEIVDEPEPIEDRFFLVLSIGEGTAGKIRTLSDKTFADDSPFKMPLRVSHISPDTVPDHWHGLEMVDAIVWESADPSTLSPHQLQAVIEWVRHGGKLLLAAGGTIDLLASSKLAEYLPVEFEGVEAVSELPNRLAFGTWLKKRNQSEEQVEFAEPVQMARCRVKEGAKALLQSPAKTQTYLATRDVDGGSITFLCVTLHDLFGAGGDAETFFANALGWRRAVDEDDARILSGIPIELFEKLREPINFQMSTVTYLIVAILFVVAYGLAATWGSWMVLRARNLLKHSWTTFAVAAMVASALGFASVQTIRGVGTELHQLSIIDSTIDTYSSAAHCYFGLKTGTYVQDMDLWLPLDSRGSGDPQRTALFLRPLSAIVGSDLGGSPLANHFADTKRYRAGPNKALLEDVPIRATLKQFEGYWRGRMGGQLHADIRMGSKTEIARDSTITNDLGFDLSNCYLIQALEDLNWDEYSRRDQILVHPIGRLRNQEQIDLHRRLYFEPPSYVKAIEPLDYIEDRSLKTAQEHWSGSFGGFTSVGSFWENPFGSIENYQLAVMLLTTHGEFEPKITGGNWASVTTDISHANCRWLDRSGSLTRDKLLLVGFADSAEPGPVRLHVRRGAREWRSLTPEKSCTAYRFVLPILRDESAQDDPQAEEEDS